MSGLSPLIGITTYHRDETDHVKLPVNYADAVRRAGGIPLLIQPGEPNIVELLNFLDGLILSGGADVDPAFYDAAGHPAIYGIDRERDETEMALARGAVEDELPLLCICRGLQVLNVALGGTLIPHIPDVVPETIVHRQPVQQPTAPVLHEVLVADGSRLQAVLGGEPVQSASWHHQAIADLAPGLAVVASAADGIIEAVEMAGRPQVVGVQWHPEMTAVSDPTQQRLFDDLVRQASRGVK